MANRFRPPRHYGCDWLARRHNRTNSFPKPLDHQNGPILAPDCWPRLSDRSETFPIQKGHLVFIRPWPHVQRIRHTLQGCLCSAWRRCATTAFIIKCNTTGLTIKSRRQVIASVVFYKSWLPPRLIYCVVCN